MTRLWTIEAIPLYRFRVPGPEVLFQRAFSEIIDMVIYAFLLRSDHKAILVDTGLPADYSALNASVVSRKGAEAGFFAVGAGLHQELAARNVRPNEVLVTSFGPYAVGGLGQFPDIPVIGSARGLRDLAAAEEPALRHPLPDPLVARLATARAIEGERQLDAGLVFVETGIHHPASAAVIADTKQGKIAISDPVFTARNLIDGVALGAAEQAAGWHAMVRMLGARADAILPIHDTNPSPVRSEHWHSSLRPADAR
jgi:glyoxylase-like metal-dependent hydrolase (beta-lactamase superfamily II)